MKFNPQFFTTPTGHLLLIVAVIAVGGGAIALQRLRQQPLPLPKSTAIAPVLGPQTFTREGAWFKLPELAPKPAETVPVGPVSRQGAPKVATAAPKAPPILPLSLMAVARDDAARKPAKLTAPYGRLIPCETVVTIESNRLDTPVIGLVTEDVWAEGRVVIPAGAEVHGRASLDRTRERLAVTGQWVIVWRTADSHNGEELAVQGLALDRERDLATGTWGFHDGSAGLRGEILRSAADRELKLFAATFLATATAALQDTRTSAGALGEVAVPAATVRNATLAGTGAILREYAERLKEAISRDGFYVRVPAGKQFYLYVTQALNADQTRRGEPQPANSHEN
ncbi:MAG: TrbI/VirB10 family protein [Opitutaceae bacterium]|nr:TrbI/VirB10 family protein [Opitutaceae bacterium]